MTDYPSPETRHPIRRLDGSVNERTVFLAAATNHPRMRVGAYTYASAHHPPKDWAAYLAPYLYNTSPERLIIGKFCQIASGVQFITASANHRYDGISSFPFAIFDLGSPQGRPSMPKAGADTVIGNDCWIGSGATLLPGTVLGDGVIVGAGAVVSGHHGDYCTLVGNPARLVKQRFDHAKIARLKATAWWDWPIAHILAHESEIAGGDIDALERAAQSL